MEFAVARFFSRLSTTWLAAAALAAVLLASAQPAPAQDFITVASTTSTEQSGLFKHLLPEAKKALGTEVRVVAVGTGQALDMGRRGDADVVFVHDQVAEEKFLAEGFGVKRFPVMYNDFVIVGPKGDPVGAKGRDVIAGLKKIAAVQAPFASRADKSGTHAAELRYWKAAGIDQPKGAWYRETGSGMGPTLNTASGMNAYALTDRGTWLSFKNRGDLVILVEGDTKLFNQYGVMLVNPAKHPQVKKDAGQKFIDWLISPAGQAAVAGYKIDGEQLFFPNYKPEREVRVVLGLAAALVVSLGAPAQEPAKVFAAGSLRGALTEAAEAFGKAGGGKVTFEFGPSGLLKERLEKGERADVFASANMEHPQALAAAGRADPVRMFARNRMCALAHPATHANMGNLLPLMLAPETKLGTSTPKADPSGDYAWQVFERAERLRPGAYATLSRKALQLTGGPTSRPPPKDRNLYAMLVASGEAEIFLTYCTNATLAKREEPSLRVVPLPESLSVAAEYGLATVAGASAAGKAFAAFLLGPEGQRVLERWGFAPPGP